MFRKWASCTLHSFDSGENAQQKAESNCDGSLARLGESGMRRIEVEQVPLTCIDLAELHQMQKLQQFRKIVACLMGMLRVGLTEPREVPCFV